jgi:hypothetical protein
MGGLSACRLGPRLWPRPADHYGIELPYHVAQYVVAQYERPFDAMKVATRKRIENECFGVHARSITSETIASYEHKCR